ncbi:hypothetical protein HYY73_04920 [Candidatus Woesearchaeota archaeon]|nr:hypothetical protein [Candidatus Woesearchaeota archaeon]
MRFSPVELTKDLASLTYQDVIRRRLMTPFLIFASFLLAFATTRAIAYSFPSVNLIIGLYHIHHFYYGIALLVASNWIALITNRPWPKYFAAVLFGFGLGIIADELGLLLTCTSPQLLQCNYYARITLDIFITIVAAFLSVLYFMPVLRRFRRITYRTLMLMLGVFRRRRLS